MKVYTYFTESHKYMFDNYFKKSLIDLEIKDTFGEQDCLSGSYYQDGWKNTTMKKVDVFIKACEENQGDVFVYSDVDIQFFGPIKEALIEELGDFDIAIQNDYLGGMCSGFFVCRGNERTLKMFQNMKNNESQYLEDQHALNMNLNFVRFKPLSHRFWTFGIYKTQWKNQNFDIPQDILMHHANWTEGIQNKTTLLNFVRQKFELKKLVKDNLENYQDFLNEYFKEFRPDPTYPVYPPYHTGKYLEDYFYEYFNNNNKNKEVYYLPIGWTTSYIQNLNLGLLQEKLLSLDKDKIYFTVSQHDDAIKEYLPPNTKKFCAGGNAGGIPIPLVCSPIPQNYLEENERDIFCSFVGSLTHPIRYKMNEILKDKPKYKIDSRGWSNKVNEKDFLNFVNITSRSIFTLCPRGYGKNSFRMYESMQLGSIPVYIYDDDWRPFKDTLNWDDFSISVHINDLEKLDETLSNISEERIKLLQKNLVELYKEKFSLESTSKEILLRI